MNILEYVKGGGVCKSACGWKFFLSEISTGKYPIKGYLITNTLFKYNCEWNEDGYPINLPTNHGLNLIPVVPIVKYEMVSIDMLKRYMQVEDFVQDQKIFLKDERWE